MKKQYEHNPYQLIQALRAKGIVVNDTESTETIRVSSTYDVQVSPKGIYVGMAREIGNKTRGKIDFLTNYLGFSDFGWGDYTKR